MSAEESLALFEARAYVFVFPQGHLVLVTPVEETHWDLHEPLSLRRHSEEIFDEDTRRGPWAWARGPL